MTTEIQNEIMCGEDAPLAELVGAFKGAMRRLAATVTIVTTGSAAERNGMTATAVSSVTTDPPALLVCVNRTASLHPSLLMGSRFCINLLHVQHAELSHLFGGKALPEERFQHGQWAFDEHGTPYLTDAQSNLFCVVDALLDYGTHTIFVGKVKGIRLHGEVAPLIYRDGRFVSN